MSQEANAGAEDAAGKEVEGQEAATGAEQFDAERAMATIQKQRESEKAALQKAKDLEAELAKYKEAEDAKAEEGKALEVKVAERDEALKAKDAEIADLHVRFSFLQEAQVKGVADPELAYLAAKQEGLLGAYDPKEGKVGEHNWTALGEKYTSFSTEQSAQASTGDAGRQGKGKVLSEGDQFNQAIRNAVHSRRG